MEHETLEGWMFHFTGGFGNVMVIAVFVASYRFLFYWRDFSTALELAGVGWLAAGINICRVLWTYRNDPAYFVLPTLPTWIIDISQFVSVVSIALVPSFLSVPFVWFYLHKRRKMRLQLNVWLLACFAFLAVDFLLYHLVFFPLLGFLIRHTMSLVH